MHEPILSPRLAAAAGMVRKGGEICDVGTDRSIVCVVFLADFFARMWMADHSWRFFFRNLYFFLLSVPYLNIVDWMGIELSHAEAMLMGLVPLLRALLGLYVLFTWIDPGVTAIFTAYAAKHHFDEIHYLDIVDCNAGNHGMAFATNFNPEINIREVTQKGRYYENGKWVVTEPHEIHKPLHYPEIGERESYVIDL